MRIGIDCDGVLRNFVGSVKRTIKNRHPELKNQLNLEPTNWNFKSWLPFWNEDEAEDFIFNKHYLDIFTSATAFQEAIEDWPILKKWASENNHELVLVSAQRNNTVNPTTLWLAMYEFDFKEIYYTHDKWKANTDILIDDSISKLKKFQENSNGIPICMKRNWNKKCWNKYISINRLSDIMSICFG
tara:strand:+ start:4874 stop:5431 length:558 start_codon:yes stop_codon:yes gene_type:complete